MLPADIVNRALDQLPGAAIIGAFSDGTKESEAARRIYGPTLRQLLRTATWNFARKRAPLELLGDASGQSVDLATGQAVSNAVEPPWRFAYAWPSDGVRARWLPQRSGQSGAAVPIMTGLNPGRAIAPRPARFLVSSSDQFPVVVGETDWASLPDSDATEGVGLLGRRIVLTDVVQASLVYTKLALDPAEWDALFTEAFVAILASRLALPLVPEPKLALQFRAQQVAIAKDIVREARTVDANDAGFPQTTDHQADWIRARRGGWSDWGGFDGPGYLSCGWEPMGFADGSVF